MPFVLTQSVMRMPAVVFVVVLVMMCGGCGSPVSDEAARPLSLSTSSTSHDDKATASHSMPADETITHHKIIEREVSGSTAVNQSQDRDPASISIPYSIANDLTSPEARTRLRALEHWEQKDSKIPLDAVFEAMEDEDEAVRARATAIIEQRWTSEQEDESG